ncbi:hypothetical protein ACJRO7_036186 [Eucalyptus globulus]|uniref:Peroxidase n=1 Tax=Eucalyptus globulus TaxID=34317 RepID=A0ABD3J9Y4_EUCGL
MASTPSAATSLCRFSIFFSMLVLLCMSCHAQLSFMFYDESCPNALTAIKTSIRIAVSRKRQMAASLIRLHFHNCFNRGSVRGYEVIDYEKSEVEKICPGVVSCADIVAVATRDASVAVGDPSWMVKLGRRDSTTVSPSLTSSDLPSFREGLEKLESVFPTTSKGLSVRDMVALSGRNNADVPFSAYVMQVLTLLRQAQCFTFRERIYSNGSDIDAEFASTHKRRCPARGDNATMALLDVVTPDSFDNNYFKSLMQKKGLLKSDQVLFSGGSTDNIVSEYSKKPASFKLDFAAAMVKMGDISLLTRSSGQIRRICSSLN